MRHVRQYQMSPICMYTKLISGPGETETEEIFE